MFNWFKKTRQEFKPSRFVKDYIISKNVFSEIDKMKLMMSSDLSKNLNITINYDVLADALALLDIKYYEELRKDIKAIMPDPPAKLPDKPKVFHEESKIDEMKKELMKELMNELRSETPPQGKNGTV